MNAQMLEWVSRILLARRLLAEVQTMLKAQLRSKMLRVHESWRDVEDILTGDFFGTLDYLPRQPFLVDLICRIGEFSQAPTRIPLAGVDWQSVQLLFWPLTKTDDESAEPDVVLVSNQWVIVIEVKLHSDLGSRQPWREYVVGQEIARLQNISPEAVYYVAVSPDSLDNRVNIRTC